MTRSESYKILDNIERNNQSKDILNEAKKLINVLSDNLISKIKYISNYTETSNIIIFWEFRPDSFYTITISQKMIIIGESLVDRIHNTYVERNYVNFQDIISDLKKYL